MRIKPSFKRESRRYKVKVLEIGAYIELILHLESFCKTRLFTSWTLGTTQWFDQMWIKSGDFNGANSVSVRGVTSHIDERNSIRILGFLHILFIKTILKMFTQYYAIKDLKVNVILWFPKQHLHNKEKDILNCL